MSMEKNVAVSGQATLIVAERRWKMSEPNLISLNDIEKKDRTRTP